MIIYTRSKNQEQIDIVSYVFDQVKKYSLFINLKK